MSNAVTVHELALAASINMDNLTALVTEHVCSECQEQLKLVQDTINEIVERTK